MTVHRLLPLFVSLCAGLGACTQSTAKTTSAPPDVLLVCWDTVRADHLGCYGYEEHPTTPTLDRLAAESLHFLDASAAAGWTKPSVPSFLTGTYPARHGVYEGSARLEPGAVTDVLPASALTLAEVFLERGYRTGAFLHNAQLRRGNGFEQGFEHYDDGGGDAESLRWRSRDWLDTVAVEEPFFLYLHFLDAHWPYPVPEAYATRFASAAEVAPFRGGGSRALRDAINSGEHPFGEAERRALLALYDGAIRYLDDQLALVLEDLERRGRWENTVVALVSDHGEEFGERGRIGHGHGLSEDLLRVPWVLRVPEGTPRRIENPVSLVDLWPTVLAAAGIPAPQPVEGVDRLAEPDRKTLVFAEHKAPNAYSQSLRAGEEKLLRRFEAVRALDVKPGELVEVGARWEAELEQRDGVLVARELEPGDDEDDDPCEVKGRYGSHGPSWIEVEGLRFPLSGGVEWSPVAGASERPVAGQMVKLRFGAAGEPVDWVKLYAPGAEAEFELRGPVTLRVLEGEGGKLRLCGLDVAFDATTDFDDLPTPKARLDRAEVLAILSRREARAAYPATVEGFRLAGQREEPGAVSEELREELDRLGQRFAGESFYAADDQLLLSPEAIEALEAIGYVE